MKIINKLAISFCILTFATSCGNVTPPIENKVVLPTSITLNPDSLTLEIGQKFRNVEVTFAPTNADQGLVWTVSDEKIAEVTQLGEVTALTPGETIVVATSKVDESVKAELKVVVNRGPLTASEKINNSLGNIKFEGEAYKELYSENQEKPGHIIKGKMTSLFTKDSYHFELGEEFDTLDYGGSQVSLWEEEGKTYQYLHNAFTNEIQKVEAKYDDGTAVAWDEFTNPMNIIKDLKFQTQENIVKLDLTNGTMRKNACKIIERVAFWPFEIDVIEDVTLKFDENRLTNISFRTIKHSDKFQECVYGASLDVVGYGEEVTSFPKPTPLIPTVEQAKLEKALKKLDDSTFVMEYKDELSTFAEGKFYKTNNAIYYNDVGGAKYSRGIVEINGEVFEVGYSFELKKIVRLNKPILNEKGEKATLKELGPSYSAISSVFYKNKENESNVFYLDDSQLCKYFGNLASNCGGPFDLGLIMSTLTEISLSESGDVNKITALYDGLTSASLTVSQLGGEITLPIDLTTLETVENF